MSRLLLFLSLDRRRHLLAPQFSREAAAAPTLMPRTDPKRQRGSI